MLTSIHPAPLLSGLPMSRGKERLSALAHLRKAKGLSQGRVAELISEATGEEIGQAAISNWELGNTDMRKVHPRRLRAYAEALGIDIFKLADAIGHDAAELFHDQVAFTHTTSIRSISLPSGLVAAVEKFGSIYDDLRDPVWQRYLAGFNWREGTPEDPQEWVDLYRDLRRAGIVPGGN